METVTASIFFVFSDSAKELHTFFMIAESDKETNKILNRCKDRMSLSLYCCMSCCFCSCFTCCRRVRARFMGRGHIHGLPTDGISGFFSQSDRNL